MIEPSRRSIISGATIWISQWLDERRAEVERARETQWLLEEELRKKKLVHSKTTFVNAMKNYVATLREVLPPKQDPYVGVNVSVVGMERLVSRVEAVIRSMEALIGE